MLEKLEECQKISMAEEESKPGQMKSEKQAVIMSLDKVYWEATGQF